MQSLFFCRANEMKQKLTLPPPPPPPAPIASGSMSKVTPAMKGKPIKSLYNQFVKAKTSDETSLPDLSKKPWEK